MERSDVVLRFSGGHTGCECTEDGDPFRNCCYTSADTHDVSTGNSTGPLQNSSDTAGVHISHLQSELCTAPVNTQRTALLSRSSLNEPFGFALQTYVFKRGASGIRERITYIDYVRESSIAADGGVQKGDVVVAVNGIPVLTESHKGLIELMSSQLNLHLVLVYQDIARILALSVRSLQLQYILAEKYILLEQIDMEEASILNGSAGSLSTDLRRARWLSVCRSISKSLNVCRKFLGKGSKPVLCRLHGEPDLGLLHISASFPHLRMTSSGPPPTSPSKPGSFSDRYDKFIAQWPKVHTLHRMVVDGSRWCFSDIKTYLRIKRELSSKVKTLADLSMAELEVLVQMPIELPRVAVTAVLIPLPFGFYVVGFAIIFFPRLVLTRHFWSDVQRKEFFQIDVARSMTNSAFLLGIVGNPASVEGLRLPNVEELRGDVLIALSAIHSMYPFPGIRRRFQQRCKAMRQLDKVVGANIGSLTARQLHFHLFIRRISNTGNSEAEMRRILKSWLEFTKNLDDAAYLCAPVFFNRRT
ncbi:hypothetical protein RB195_006535 [Necator americanus]|uniref:PDZ domain-containing protein n=1 Tax=Necator americanus TaxID=51031 RepID=A0ABR1BT31_NECAM